MQQFVFDKDGIHGVIRLAYRYGYVEGVQHAIPNSVETLEKEATTESGLANMGDILSGYEPGYWLNDGGKILPYSTEPDEPPSRFVWFCAGVIFGLGLLAILLAWRTT